MITDVLEKDFVDPLEPTNELLTEPIYDAEPFESDSESHISKEINSSPVDITSSHPSKVPVSHSESSHKMVTSPLVTEISIFEDENMLSDAEIIPDEDEEIADVVDTPIAADTEMHEIGFQDSKGVQGRTQSQGGAIVTLGVPKSRPKKKTKLLVLRNINQD
ncbi:unnamed protein product [Mucor hiemalis]